MAQGWVAGLLAQEGQQVLVAGDKNPQEGPLSCEDARNVRAIAWLLAGAVARLAAGRTSPRALCRGGQNSVKTPKIIYHRACVTALSGLVPMGGEPGSPGWIRRERSGDCTLAGRRASTLASWRTARLPATA